MIMKFVFRLSKMKLNPLTNIPDILMRDMENVQSHMKIKIVNQMRKIELARVGD